MIIMEELMPVVTPLEGPGGIGPAYRAPVRKDMMMLVICEGGRERSALEYDALTKQAGFKSFRVVSQVGDTLYAVMEAHK